jgi:BRCT domain type II-containing protein
MSSPKASRGKAKSNAKSKTARAKAVRKPAARKAAARKATAAKSKPAKPNAKPSEASIQASALAAAIEKSLIDGPNNTLSEQASQDLLAALCKSYSARVEAGEQTLPIRGRTSVNSTDIMTTASGLLKAANLAVFELGMWQSWTGR